jgi:DNA helicase-2/ATP-dependent DNA helicase PcrA
VQRNELQQRVIDHWQHPVLVMAPVGTGKTMTLAARAAAAISGGMNPARMLCLSFTNRAAREVNERIGAAVRCCTFHALCANILRAEARVLGLPSDFVIYDEEDCTEIAGRVAQRRQIAVEGQNQRLRYALWQALSDARLARFESGGKPSEVFHQKLRESGLWPAFGPPEFDFAGIARDYVSLLRESHAVDFTDLILGVNTLLADYPERQAWWRARYDWIQVDEVQDTSRSEYRILNTLAGDHRQLSFFGDVDQTIYEWRGSAPQEILEHYKREYAPLVVHFEENFRSTRRILQACERVIRAQPQALTQRILPSSQEEGEPVRVLPFGSPNEEYDWIAEQIQEDYQRHKLRWRDFAVLVRTNYTARVISEALEGAGVPHVRVEEEKFFQRAEIKAAIAHLRLLRNQNEANSLHRYLQTPPKGVGEATLRKLADLPRQAGLRLGDLLLPATHQHLDPFGPLLNCPAVVVDVETTGTDVTLDEVVELAALRGEEEFHRLIKPTRAETWERLEQAAAIHGIGSKRLEAEGVDPEQAFAEFAEFVKDHVVVGHNLEAFDWPLILRQSGLSFAIAGTADTLEISRRLLDLHRYRLENVVEALGVKKRDAHHAMEDVRMTADVLAHLKVRLAEQTAMRQEVVSKVGGRFVELAGQMADWRQRAQKQSPLECLDMVLYEGLLREHFGRMEDGERRLEHLEELRRIVGQAPTLDAALEVSALGLDLERQLGEEDRVRILTVHQAKGLEFDTVFVAKAVEGEFPSWRSMRENRLDEEHRLFYVAVSRARNRLYVTWQQRDEHGRSVNSSRYLKALRG